MRQKLINIYRWFVINIPTFLLLAGYAAIARAGFFMSKTYGWLFVGFELTTLAILLVMEGGET
ncbi:MAG: hypothetical protein LKF36_05540 [Lactobacillus sp.]|jgi:hypothetical protein|nr:hypothetical protein [Lactobacillus sp.]